MAELQVSGVDLLLFIGTDGINYDTIICLTDQSLTRTTTEIDAKSKCGPSKLPGTKENGITFSGQIMSDPDSGKASIDQLDDYWRYDTLIYFKYGKAAPLEGDVVYYGTGFISQLNETAPQDGAATFDGVISIYGIVEKTTATS